MVIHFATSHVTAGLLILVISLLSLPAGAAEANLKRQDFTTATCNVRLMDVRFELGEELGEAVISSQVQWQAGENTQPDCLSGNTTIWLQARTEFDQVRFIKIKPEVLPAGAGFGESITEAPSWGVLFCDQPSNGANCESAENARRLITSNLQFEDFDITTEQLAVTTLGRQKTLNQAAKRTDVGLDSLLSDAIDNAITPNGGTSGSATSANRRQPDAESAVSSIVSLISSSLAEYQTPPHSCETQRTVANWVQARSTCELNFKSESNHDYICTDSGQPKRIRASRSASIDFSKDIKSIADIRHQTGRFATLVVEFNGEIQNTVEGDYKTTRWHITAPDSQLGDLKKLASNLVSLRTYCERNAS